MPAAAGGLGEPPRGAVVGSVGYGAGMAWSATFTRWLPLLLLAALGCSPLLTEHAEAAETGLPPAAAVWADAGVDSAGTVLLLTHHDGCAQFSPVVPIPADDGDDATPAPRPVLVAIRPGMMSSPSAPLLMQATPSGKAAFRPCTRYAGAGLVLARHSVMLT
jgi:hypothetical protein